MPRRLGAYLLLAGVGGLAALVMWLDIDGVRAGEPLRWESPWAGVLVGGALLLCWVLLHLRPGRSASFSYSRVPDLLRARRGWVARLADLPAVLRIVAVALIAVALARPQTFKKELLKVEGIDLMFILDLSESMREDDLRRNRLDAGQRTLREFLRARQGRGDRIGLVVFAREAMLQCPLTLDYRALERIVANLGVGDVPEMGTAIGDALGLALASLRRSDAQSKVIILLSDGDSNIVNEMNPEEATELAAAMGVRVFTVLVGSEGAGRQGLAFGGGEHAVNPELLQHIARETGGRYFGAGDDDELAASFAEIREELKKSERRVVGTTPDRELYRRFLVLALLLLGAELALRFSRWRSFP